MSMRTKKVLAGLLISCWAVLLSLAAPGDPPNYVIKSTWHESLLASLESVVAAGVEDGFAPFESETMRGGEPAKQLSVSLGRAKDVFLFVTGVPDTRWAVADWAGAKLIRADGSSETLTGSSDYAVLQGRCERDLTLKSGLYQKMRLNGGTFESGLNVQADSIIQIPAGGEYARFEATIGVDDWPGTNGSVRFSVLGARRAGVKRLWTPLMRDFGTGPDRQERRVY